MVRSEIQNVKLRFGIIGNAEGLNRAIDVAIQVAPTDLSVLITGESGVGKENFPQIIHQFSRRKHGQYIAVNCGAIPEGTIDSELFGHEKGAFTGAISDRNGYFAEANGGTIFLAVCIFLLFIGWQNFYKENVVTRIMAKIGKDYSMLIYVLHYAVLQALSKCFKGRHTMLARGYRQYGMMFVFAATVVLVAAYGAAKRKLRENSTVKVGNAVLERV